jgi:hypothetical protein
MHEKSIKCDLLSGADKKSHEISFHSFLMFAVVSQ